MIRNNQRAAILGGHTQGALSRIFNRCEEIDPKSGYNMLEDIQFVRGFINKHKPQAKSEVQE